MARRSHSLANLDARHRLAIASVAAIAVWFALRSRVQLPTQCIATWNVFALSILVLAWVAIIQTPAKEIRERAREQDLSRTLIFIFAVAAAGAGLFSVGFLFYTNKVAHHEHDWGHVLLSVVAVISSWSLVHTVFGLRYAHIFYGDRDDATRNEHAGGLEFPGEPLPDYTDFAYFAFVIGMTFQVSDVQITSRPLRQLVLVHGILAFGFNTVILALTVNTVSALI